MEDRRKDDPWKELVDTRLDMLSEKLEKNNMMTAEMLEAWDAVRGGFKALSFLAKAMKVLAGIAASFGAFWAALELFFKK